MSDKQTRQITRPLGDLRKHPSDGVVFLLYVHGASRIITEVELSVPTDATQISVLNNAR
jgi:hypothetical protein